MTEAIRPPFPGKQLALAVPTSLTMAAVGAVIGSLSSDIGAIVGMGAGAALGSALSSVMNDVAAWLWAVIFHHGGHWVKPHRPKRPKLVTALVVSVAAAAGFAVAMGGLSAVEASVFGGRSLSSEVTHTRASGTTFGSVLDAHPASPAPSSTGPSATSPSVVPTVTPTLTPTPDPSTVTPVPSFSPSASLAPANGIPSMQEPSQSSAATGESTP